MFPVLEDAARRGQDELIYTLISSNRVSAEDFIADGYRTPEEIDQILKTYGQKIEEEPAQPDVFVSTTQQDNSTHSNHQTKKKKARFPVVENAERCGVDWVIYKAVVSELAPVEKIAQVYNRTPEEIETIVKTFSQKEDKYAEI